VRNKALLARKLQSSSRTMARPDDGPRTTQQKDLWSRVMLLLLLQHRKRALLIVSYSQRPLGLMLVVNLSGWS